jgi:ribose 5-phosphate isomerase B
MTMNIIAFGADHGGVALKEALLQPVAALGYQVQDMGTQGDARVNYPDYAKLVCAEVMAGKAQLGILICGTGIGMSIAANRYKAIRAARICSVEDAQLARQHNNANVLCFGGRQMSLDLVLECIKAFLATEFEGGRHIERLQMMECMG